MNKIFKTLVLMGLVIPGIAISAEDSNTGTVIFVGQIMSTTAGGEGVCELKVGGATFANSCPSAGYQTVYFLCNSNSTSPTVESRVGKDMMSMALAAFMGGKKVTIVSDACSGWGSSVANLKSLRVEQP